MPKHPLTRGFDEKFLVPHSRHTSVHRKEIEKHNELDLLSYSDEAGVSMIGSKNMRQFFITGHFEYDADTLASEYFRDLNAGLPIEVPENYFPNNDPTKTPPHLWKCHANLLYSNWLNFIVYQMTPFDLETL